MKQIIIVFLLLFINAKVKGQVLDTTKVALNTKLTLMNLSEELWSEEQIKSLIKAPNPSLNFVKSRGFRDVKFFTVVIPNGGIRFDIEKSNGENEVFYFDPYLVHDDIGVFALDLITDKLYLLSCSEPSSMKSFFYVINHRKALSINDKAMRKKSRFLNSFYIEGVDLKCLWDSYHYR